MTRRPLALARVAPGLVAVVLALSALAGCKEHRPLATLSPRLSLLTVGDTGNPPGRLRFLDPGLAVAAAMRAEDRRRAVDAVVLLGDNFYPDGLERAMLEERLSADLVGRFCWFVRLTPTGRASLGGSCPAPPDARHPVPIFAVLGNHDYHAKESPDLERHEVSRYVENWDLPAEPATVRELPGGVSLVLVDSMRWVRFDSGDAVEKALLRAHGPWRVVVGHYPLADTGPHFNKHYAKRMRKMIERAGVPVQLSLSGHEHSLQVIAPEAKLPALQVIAGGGSDTRAVEGSPEGRRFGRRAFGFARVDLVGDEAPELVVTLFAVSPHRIFGDDSAEPVTRWAVDLAGDVRELPIEFADAGAR